jgi:hypothetical protein
VSEHNVEPPQAANYKHTYLCIVKKAKTTQNISNLTLSFRLVAVILGFSSEPSPTEQRNQNRNRSAEI